MAIKASSSVTIIKVNDGDSGIIVSATAPSAPTIGQLWQTKTGQPIKRWDGKMWVIHYISVENIDVNALSAISANLGTVTAGTIKSADDSLVFDVTNGVLRSFNNRSLESTELKSGCLSVSGKDRDTSRIELSIYPGALVCNRNGGPGNATLTMNPGYANGSGDVQINGIPVLGALIPPIGWIEMTAVNINPSKRYKGTQWVAWGSGRVPVGVNSNELEFDSVEKTGGEKTHVLSAVEMPSHGHYINIQHSDGSVAPSEESLTSGLQVGGRTRGCTKEAGGGRAHNNLQPYVTCYMWKRTA